MKKFLLGLLLLTGLVIAVLLYERLFVEKHFGPVALLGLSLLAGFFGFVLLTYLLHGTRHGRVMGGMWLVGVSTVLAYLALDLLAGALLIKPLSPPLVPDAYVHHRLVPDSRARLQQSEFSYIQRVNNVGMRGADVQVEKQPGRYRIAMLGDSFTMGKGVEDDETFAVLVEAALNAADMPRAACGVEEIEVLNAGVDSYAPVLQLIQMQRQLPALGLDMVVVNLDVSDLVQEAAYRSQAVRSADGSIVAVPNLAMRDSFTERMRNWIDRRMLFTRALLFYVSHRLGPRDLNVRSAVTQAGYETIAYTLEEDMVDRQAQWDDLFSSILGMKKLADEQGISFVLSIYPWAHEVSDTEWVPGRLSAGIRKGAVVSDRRERTIRRFAEENRIALADAFPAFRASKGAEQLYYKLDMHWTAAGQRVMAGSMADFLKQHMTELCK